jgi:hypothetical protein
MPEVWERQLGETSKAYAAFCVYRDLGPQRSLEAVRKEFAKNGKRISIKFLGRWSAKYRWVERAAAYDDYLDRRRREEKERAILDMAERHAREAVALQQKALARLRELDPAELSPRDVLNYLVEAMKLERLSRGEPTEIGKQEVMLPALVEVVTDEKGAGAVAPGPDEGLEERG